MQLHFIHRGETHSVTRDGFISRTGTEPSRDWLFIGGSRHHWRRGVDVTLADAFTDPASLVGCLVWDRDHGTTRQWLGHYAGGLPRVTAAWLE